MNTEVKLGLDKDTFFYLMVSALEGGSNYWYSVDTKDFPSRDEYPNLAPSERIAEKVWNGGTVPVYFIEDGEHLGDLSLKGIIHQWENSPENKEMINAYMMEWTGNGDADSADVFFQIALMGELTFA